MGRAPHGARGLKSARCNLPGQENSSRPTRGAWIEITVISVASKNLKVAPHTGRDGVNPYVDVYPLANQVAPHTGRVD